MPEDWVGHPLRKDYDVGRIPVQFKRPRAAEAADERRRHRRHAATPQARSDRDVDERPAPPRLESRPHVEGARRCGPAASCGRRAAARVGSVLRMSEAEAADAAEQPVEPTRTRR
jgi:hypothetical protein